MNANKVYWVIVKRQTLSLLYWDGDIDGSWTNSFDKAKKFNTKELAENQNLKYNLNGRVEDHMYM